MFRRGEPHLLASIKRKTTRPSNADEGRPLVSPTEELDGPKMVAGWMNHGSTYPQTSFRTNSPPPRDIPAPGSRSHGFGWDSRSGDPPRGVHDERRPSSKGYPWETSQLAARMPRPPEPQRYDPSRPSLPAQRYAPPGYPDSPFYPQPQHSPVDALSGQVATLEDRVQRLTETLNAERIDNVRSNIDFTSYLLQLTGWVGEGKGECRRRGSCSRAAPAPPDVRTLQDTLTRASGDLRQRYETLMASDTLSSMAGGERSSRSSCEWVD